MDAATYLEKIKEPAAERARRLARLRAMGLTMEKIAEAEGISRQRVHQILRDHGLIDSLPKIGA